MAKTKKELVQAYIEAEAQRYIVQGHSSECALEYAKDQLRSVVDSGKPDFVLMFYFGGEK